MKRHYKLLIYSLLPAAVMLSACQKDDTGAGYEGEDIAGTVMFSPAIESDANQTKGSMVTGTTYDYSSLGPFWVKAWNKDATSAQFGYTKVMQFTHTAGSGHTYWSTVDDSDNILEYFWKKDNSGTIETKYFYAYTNLPSSGATVTSNNWYSQNLQYNVYQIPNASDQKDILLGLGHGTGYTKTDYVGRFVDIKFGHPLSAIKFKKGTIEGWVDGDKITDIKIVGVYSSGKYYNNDSGSSWTPSSSTTVNMSNSSGLTIGTGDIIGEAFFLIPQNLATQNITIKVTLTVGGVTYADISATLNRANDKPSDTWIAGKYYTYTLNYTAGNTPVLSVSLADWGDIKENADMEDGSVLGYDYPDVKPWGDGVNDHTNYTD